jgi:hypothetical protein
MSPLADLSLWLFTALVDAFVVCLFVFRGLFRKFIFLNMWLLLLFTAIIVRYAVLFDFGISSQEYFYTYFYTDALITAFLFLSICELSSYLFGTGMPRRGLMLLRFGALIATACLSSFLWSFWSVREMNGFILDLSVNIYLASGLVIVLLWIWKLLNRPADRLAARFVNVLLVYFSLYFLMYAGVRVAPNVPSLDAVPPMAGAWLPLGCAFAILSNEQPRSTISPS